MLKRIRGYVAIKLVKWAVTISPEEVRSIMFALFKKNEKAIPLEWIESKELAREIADRNDAAVIWWGRKDERGVYRGFGVSSLPDDKAMAKHIARECAKNAYRAAFPKQQ